MNDDLSLTRYEKLCMEFQEAGRSPDIIDVAINTDSLVECYGRFWVRLNTIMNKFMVDDQAEYKSGKFNLFTTFEIAAFIEASASGYGMTDDHARSDEPYYLFTAGNRFTVSVYSEMYKNKDFNLAMTEYRANIDTPYKCRFIKVTDLVENAKQIGWQFIPTKP